MFSLTFLIIYFLVAILFWTRNSRAAGKNYAEFKVWITKKHEKCMMADYGWWKCVSDSKESKQFKGNYGVYNLTTAFRPAKFLEKTYLLAKALIISLLWPAAWILPVLIKLLSMIKLSSFNKGVRDFEKIQNSEAELKEFKKLIKKHNLDPEGLLADV